MNFWYVFCVFCGAYLFLRDEIFLISCVNTKAVGKKIYANLPPLYLRVFNSNTNTTSYQGPYTQPTPSAAFAYLPYNSISPSYFGATNVYPFPSAEQSYLKDKIRLNVSYKFLRLFPSRPWLVHSLGDTHSVSYAESLASNSFVSEEKQEPLPFRGAKIISALTQCISKPFLSYDEIKNILPHRFPFLLLDKIIEFEPGKRAVGVKQISGNEDQFNGHFPQKAIFPGVLQIEALAQLGGIVCLLPPINKGKVENFLFASVDGVKWKKPILPGDTLVMETELITWRPNLGIAKMKGQAFVDGVLAVDIKELTFAVF